ncbi:MAG: HK97-gp10 family putative phage morphogenesis protein [Phyllobacterium sp.]
MARRVQIEGLKELDKALGELPKATAKATLRRVLKDAGEPIARAARQNAPTLTFHLNESVDVSTTLSRRQRSLHKSEGGQAFQEMFVGTNDPAGMQQEFGNERHGAQPFMRPAWDEKQGAALEVIVNQLWTEIQTSAKRLARKRAK